MIGIASSNNANYLLYNYIILYIPQPDLEKKKKTITYRPGK